MQKRQRELEADNASLRAEVTDLMKQMREEINKVTLGAPFGRLTRPSRLSVGRGFYYFW
jgi:hypothetical protein